MKKRVKKVLITGSEGSICKNGFIEYFQDIFDGIVYLTDFKKSNRKNFFKIDLTDEKQIKKLPKDIDTVIHMAYLGLPSEIKKLYYNNIFSTLNLLQYYQNSKVAKFIFLSSVCVYGLPNTGVFPNYLPVDENHPEKTVDHYGMSKSVVEKLLFNFSKISPFSIIILRAGSVITKSGNTYEFRMRLIENDESYRYGGELWNFVDYRDLARGIKVIITLKTRKYDIFNFTSDDHLMKTNNYELMKFISKSIQIRNNKFLMSRRSFFDNSKFKNYFNFSFLFPAERFFRYLEKNKKEKNYYKLKR